MGKRIINLPSVTSALDEDEFLILQNSTKETKKITKRNLFNGSTGIVVRGKVIDPDRGDLGIATAIATNNAALALSTANGAQTSANGKNEVYYQTSQPTVSNFTGSISGTTLTVTAIGSGSVAVGKAITNASITDGTVVTAQLTGSSGSTGTYTVSISQTVGSSTIYGGYNVGDLWYDTDDSYKLYVYQNSGTWAASFAPMLTLDANNNVTGLVKVGATRDFVLVADKFQVWNGTSAEVPFEIVGGNVKIKNAQIQTVDAGKLTAGFIGAQVIAVNGTDVYSNSIAAGGYIESTSFVLTWPGVNYVNVKTYNGSALNLGKSVPSDVVQVKVLQSDGSYKLFRALQDQPKSAGQTAPPSAGSNTYWQEIASASIPTISVPISSTESTNIQNFGFRVASNGYAEFGGSLFRGAVIANEGFFGNKKDAARIDSNGLTVGPNGRIKSSGIGYDGTNFNGGSGFFLGNTQAEGQTAAYQFFVGNTSGNYVRWDGVSTLYVYGNIVGGTTLGGSSGSDGLVIKSATGIRTFTADQTLTITGGIGNGISYGAQIDFSGTGTGVADGKKGVLVLQGGSTGGSLDNGKIEFRTNTSDGTSGVVRAQFRTAGEFIVYKNTSQGGSYTSGSGCAQFNGNVSVGRNFETIDSFGNTSGKLHVQTEIAVYTGASTRQIILTGSTGDVTAVQFTTSSSKRVKTNIKKLKSGIDIIDKLKPVSFKRKNTKQQDIGLIAEEVDEILPVIVKHNEKNEAEGLDYSKLTVVLINAVKELSAEIKELKSRLKDANTN